MDTTQLASRNRQIARLTRAAGEEKAWAVRAVQAGAEGLPPSGMVDAARTVWLVDQAAVAG